jgi:hypothetical protein
LGDTFFVKFPLGDRALMEGARIARRRQKGVAAENKGKDAQPVPAIRLRHGEQTAVMAGDREHSGKVELEELLGNRTCTLVVKTPPHAIGQHAPTKFARREVVHATQITQHLRGRGRLLTVSP